LSTYAGSVLLIPRLYELTKVILSSRSPVELTYTRWMQLLMGVLMMDIEYQTAHKQEPSVQLLIKVRLAYRNVGDAEDDWKELDENFVHRR